MDKNETAFLSLDVQKGIDSILEQYVDSNYGKVKYSKNALFWMGYSKFFGNESFR